MNDDLRPDALDDELSRRFGAGAPSAADPDAVLDAMRPRLEQARTRRRVSFASAIAGIAAVVVVLAFVLGGGDGGESVRTPPASNDPRPTTPSTPPTSAPTGGSGTPDTTPATVDDRGDDSTVATTPTVPDTTPVTNAPPAISPPAPTEQGFTSAGGSILVRLSNGEASLVSSSPAAGYSAETHDNGPTRVEVRFSNGQTEWRIRVDVVDGQLVSEVTQHG
jgi:hypothetical protein